MTVGRKSEPWSQELTGIEGMVKFELIDEVSRYKFYRCREGKWRSK